jgi:NADH:ubiquinone oxidoreductase subunit 5 (subunit L)/multisubunit Na+/H+ antiporter MnhA subunit
MINLIFLQAAKGASEVIIVLLVIFLLIGVPILSGFFMKTLWSILKKETFINNDSPYYKDPILYILSLIGSVAIVFVIFYFSLLLFDKLNPNFGYYN